MSEMIGRVTRVFIPEEYINNQLVDVMDAHKIGFNILIDGTENIEIIMEQNEMSASIYRDDLVIVKKDNSSGKIITIERIKSDDYE